MSLLRIVTLKNLTTMTKKTTQVLMLSLLLAGSAAAIGNFVYAAEANANAHAQAPLKVVGVPYKPTNLTATAAEPNDDGTADVTLTFTTPTRYWDDDEYSSANGLDEITSIAVVEGTSTIYTEEFTEIGVEHSIVLEKQSSGSHTYKVYILNSESDESVRANYYSYASVTIKVGYDAPGSVGDLTVTNNNPEVSISWTAPTAGKEGGTFRSENLVYDVYRYISSKNKTQIATGISDLSFTDNVSYDKPTQIWYGVVARNDDGSSDASESSKIIVGKGYSIPFSETFSGGTASNLWTKEQSNSLFYISQYFSSSGVKTGLGNTIYKSYDEDSGALYFKAFASSSSSSDDDDDDDDTAATVTENSGSYTSAPISLEGATNPALTFYQYIVPSATNKLKTSIVVVQDGTQTTVAEDDFTTAEGEEGWTPRSISLAKFAGKEITLIFKGSCPSDQIGFTAYDVISIEESRDFDLVLQSTSIPANIDAGKEFTITADIYNKGSKAAENFAVELYFNNELYKSETIESLASGESTTVTFTGTAVNALGDAAVAVKVAFDADEDTSNNSAEGSMKVRTADTPAVREAIYTNKDAFTLSWVEPDYKLPENTQVSESFEDYSDGDTSFGSWTTSSGHSYGIDFEEYDLDEDLYTGSAAFTVSNQTADSWYGKAKTGSNYLLKTNNNTDWLISPVLSGDAQTISFSIASRHQPEYYDWDEFATISSYDVVKVYYSTTTNDQSAFTQTVVSKNIESFLSNGDDFEDITAELPDGAKYFAIVVSAPTVDGWMQELETTSIVFIDDISFVGGNDAIQAELIGYNVYENDTKLNDEPLTDTSFTVANPTANAKYYIEAVYNVGNADKVEATYYSSVDTLNNSSINVYATAGQLHIEGAQSALVFDLAGRLIAKTTGDAVISVAQGSYIVKADNRVFKTIVR